MIIHRQTSLVLGFLLIVACAPEPVSDAAAPPRAIVESILREAGFKERWILGRTITIPTSDSAALVRAPWADSAVRAKVEHALADIHSRGQERWRLADSVERALGVRVVKSSPRQASFTGPAGPTLLSLSAVGFSEDSTFAAVYWQYECGVRCAGATISVYTRSPGAGWRLWRQLPLWMS